MKAIKCRVCGNELNESYNDWEPICQECFDREYWQKVIARKNNYVIIKGCCYQKSGLKGVTKFHIRMFDTEEEMFIPLKYQCKVIDKYRKYLPDNAQFIVGVMDFM